MTEVSRRSFKRSLTLSFTERSDVSVGEAAQSRGPTVMKATFDHRPRSNRLTVAADSPWAPDTPPSSRSLFSCSLVEETLANCPHGEPLYETGSPCSSLIFTLSLCPSIFFHPLLRSSTQGEPSRAWNFPRSYKPSRRVATFAR